jgi:hypothetical protein
LTAPSAVDRIRQARHLALQVGRLHVRVELLRQRRLVGAGRGQRFGELLLVQARGLFLQLHLGDAVALRLQAALGPMRASSARAAAA